MRIREQGAPGKGGNGRYSGPQVFSGYGVNTDTIVAAAEAYMGALNKMLAARQERLKAESVAYASGYDKNAPRYVVDLFGNSILGTPE